MQVAVCVITYHRPQGLARLLDGLSRLTFDGDPPGIRCIVVDNDRAGTARALCDQIRPGFRWEPEYYIEPRRRISFARAMAGACVRGKDHLIALIDYAGSTEQCEEYWGIRRGWK